jgi:hypothetical protein
VHPFHGDDGRDEDRPPLCNRCAGATDRGRLNRDWRTLSKLTTASRVVADGPCSLCGAPAERVRHMVIPRQAVPRFPVEEGMVPGFACAVCAACDGQPDAAARLEDMLLDRYGAGAA